MCPSACSSTREECLDDQPVTIIELDPAPEKISGRASEFGLNLRTIMRYIHLLIQPLDHVLDDVRDVLDIAFTLNERSRATNFLANGQ
jgi:hypothetical protein